MASGPICCLNRLSAHLQNSDSLVDVLQRPSALHILAAELTLKALPPLLFALPLRLHLGSGSCVDYNLLWLEMIYDFGQLYEAFGHL